MAPPPPPAELPDDAVGDILLRLPPDDPASLVRASLVCKPWQRILSDPDFPRRYRSFHRRPPLLGFFYNSFTSNYKSSVPRFNPTTAPSPFPEPALGQDSLFALDCHHGRVLFNISRAKTDLVVWDPITGNWQGLPEPLPHYLYTAAVLCAVRGCDHLDCHGGPFIVFFVAWTDVGLQAHLYSSESGAWHPPAHQALSYVPIRTTGVLIDDDIYFKVEPGNRILRYELGSNCLSIIEPPTVNDVQCSDVSLVSMENGSLGMTFLSCLKLSLWSMDVDLDGVAGWVQFRVIELENLINVIPCEEAKVVGSAEGFGIIFVATQVGLFTIELKSGMVKKVGDPEGYHFIYPFVSFYTPDCASRKLPSLAGAH